MARTTDIKLFNPEMKGVQVLIGSSLDELTANVKLAAQLAEALGSGWTLIGQTHMSVSDGMIMFFQTVLAPRGAAPSPCVPSGLVGPTKHSFEVPSPGMGYFPLLSPPCSLCARVSME